MDYAISMRAKPKDRLEALKARFVLTPGVQQQLGDSDPNKIMDPILYEATKEGDIDKFIDALERVSESSKLALSLIFDQVTPSGNSLLHVAASSESDNVMDIILFHYPYLMTQRNSSGDTPLHVAVQHGMLSSTRMLITLRRGSEIIYWENKDGKSPLYLAVENCKHPEETLPHEMTWEILQLLLQISAGDEDYAVKIQGMSPVFAALQKNYFGISREIMDRLPKLLHVCDEDGGTPLHSAVSVGNGGAVPFLLWKCPYLALQKDKNGSYPIHIACEGSDNFMLQDLSATWPDLAEIKNGKGQNILHVAAESGNNDAVGYILKDYGKPDVIKKLVNSKDDNGNTPLHLASMHGHCEVLSSLTREDTIALNLLNNDKLTALDVAMEPKSFSSQDRAVRGCEILIKAGVQRSKGRDVNVRSPREQSSGASEPSKWIKDAISTEMLVATLIATVTFTAGFTLPGGYNASTDSHPGMATMLQKGVFQLFVICDTLAMYNSILAVVALLWGNVSNIHIAERAYSIAGPLLVWAFISMAMAFLAAIILAVSKLFWLMTLVVCIAVLYIYSLFCHYSVFACSKVYR